MAEPTTTKLDELFRKLPKNSGLDPRLVEAARTELNLLKFRAGVSVQTHRQKTWTKTDVDQLRQQLHDKDSEIVLLKSQLKDRANFPADTNAIRRRPNEVKDRYKRLYDNEWVDVYDYFKKHGWTEIEIVVTLQRILRASYSFCNDVALEQLENIEGEAVYPSATWMDDDCIVTRMRQKQISREILELAKLYQRTTAQECLPALQKTFIESVLPTFIDPSQYSHKCINSYTSVCVGIAWTMCIQDPPMVFIDKLDRGAEFNTEFFRKFTKTGGDKFDYLVWPAMRLYQGGSVLVKGIAEPIKVANAGTAASKTKPEVAMDTSGTPPRVRSIPKISRNPEDWVDLDKNSEDNNSWDRDTPQSLKRATKRELQPDDVMPHSPYFTPYSSRTSKKDVPRIKIEDQNEDGTRGRYSRSENGNPVEYKPGNLTVMWKNKRDTSQDRITSAP